MEEKIIESMIKYVNNVLSNIHSVSDEELRQAYKYAQTITSENETFGKLSFFEARNMLPQIIEEGKRRDISL